MPGCGRPGLWNCCLRTVCPDNQRIILGLLPNVSYTRVWRAWRLSPGADKNEGPHGALTKESVKGAGRRTRLREASGLAALA